ncbi:MAG: hypothetical protein GXX96_34765 [Planctomycetaceae bacterium]|nr:hypothetical protein [Planctomycetaceae bacterium]
MLVIIAAMAGSVVFLSTAASADEALAAKEPLPGDDASVEFTHGETDRFVKGVKLFSDRDYELEEGMPDWLCGNNFLRCGIDRCSFRVTAPGILTVLTPDRQSNPRASQARALEELGFTQIEKPSLIPLVHAKGQIYQKQVKAGEQVDIGKLSVLVGFAEAVKVETMMRPWSENNGEKLYNGIVLPEQWPPRYERDPGEPMPVPYLECPPPVIPIDVGRQLLVDDFLIQETTLIRTFHLPEYYPGNPVLKPDKPWEFTKMGSFAAPYSGGVWFDPADELFKMWYHGGNMAATCYATSKDGIHWEKPDLDVVAMGTNIVVKPGMDRETDKTFDSTTIWLDDSEPEARFKYFATERASGPKRLFVTVYRSSVDGIHWSEPLAVGGARGDRTTVFYNPFRKVWVLSERTRWSDYSSRARAYTENPDPRQLIAASLNRTADTVMWAAADKLDPTNPVSEYAEGPSLYNLDAAPYESLMLGFFSIWQGPEGAQIPSRDKVHKRNDILIGYSRDGYHWDRPDRRRFISCSWDANDWRFGNVQSAAGGPLVVGDKLYFYFSGRAKVDAGLYGPESTDGRESWAADGATGLAVLRRDGFASMDADDNGGTLTTRPLLFHGNCLFVNVDATSGELAAEILDADGNAIPSYTVRDCKPVRNVDSTICQLEWGDGKDLSGLAGTPARIRFSLKNAKLFAFWVTPEKSGASHGYVGAGGPGFSGPADTVGIASREL